ncbi:nucleotidyltransferase domain-containing protein [Candidatus Bathyarchaeota archaeon]|nr:nucleotidyltransferase domain-containing protein [Candidatus Bathyarchaeota archaeon]
MKIFFPKFSKEQVVKEISKHIKELGENLGLCKAILFGSYARGNYTVASDIDLLIVFDDKKGNKEVIYKTLMKKINLPRLELHIISKKNYENLRTSKWIKTIEKEGIKIFNKNHQ